MSNYPYKEFVEEVQSKGLNMNLEIKPLLISSKVLKYKSKFCSSYTFFEHYDNVFKLKSIAEICGYGNELDKFEKIVIDLNKNCLDGIKDLDCLHHYIQVGML